MTSDGRMVEIAALRIEKESLVKQHEGLVKRYHKTAEERDQCLAELKAAREALLCAQETMDIEATHCLQVEVGLTRLDAFIKDVEG